MREYNVPFSKMKCSSNTYFISAVPEWNLLDETVRNSATLAQFNGKFITSIRPVKNSLFGVFDICDVKKLTMLRLKFSALNEHSSNEIFCVLVQCVLAILELKIMHTSSCIAPCLILCVIISLDNSHTFQN